MKLLGVAVLVVVLAPTHSNADCSSHNCYNNGICNFTSGSCACFDQYHGADCQERRCPMGIAWVDFPSADHTAHTMMIECSNMGHCNKFTGLCTCRDGFHGSACQYSMCPSASSSTKQCSGNGRCMTLHEASQEQNYVTLMHGATYDLWDAHKIHGCICDPGWTGMDCSLRTCPFGDDPGSTGQANEIQIIDCLGTSGSFTVTFRGETTEPIAFNADVSTIDAALEAIDTIDSVTTSILDSATVACDADGNSISVEFTHHAGDLPPMVLTSSLTSSGSALTLKEDGASSSYGSNVASVQGTREWVECSKRGVCNRNTGVCNCHTDYVSSDGGTVNQGTRGDCGKLVRTSGNIATFTNHECAQVSYLLDFVPDMECGGHGTCTTSADGVNNYCSACDAGYAEDCSLRSCPLARTWFSEPSATNTAHEPVECGGVGICDRTTGACGCGTLGAYALSSNNLFVGDSCKMLSCPYNQTGGTICSANGVCLNMRSWGEKAKDGQGTLLNYDYNEGSTTGSWDYETISGCFCDYNPEQHRPYASMVYSGPQSWGSYPLRGYDCSRRACATGDNPYTVGQDFETQQLTCKADGGTFTLTFRGFTTSTISFNAVAMISDEDQSSSAVGIGKGESVQQKLHNLFTIHPECYAGTCRGVDVSFSSGSSMCTADSSNVASVTFHSELGDLPILSVDSSSLTHSVSSVAFTLVESVRGTRETAICSDHGVCDEDNGRCLCHRGFSSSNGNGDNGQRGDCGWPTMFATVDAAAYRYSPREEVARRVVQTTAFQANADINI